MALANVSDAEILDAVRSQGGVSGAASYFDVPRTNLRREIERRGLQVEATPKAPKVVPTITRESLHAALVPPNTCKVKALLDTLDAESREVVEEGLGYKATDFSASALREWLIRLGFKEDAIPGTGAITDHRNDRRPCRCRG